MLACGHHHHPYPSSVYVLIWRARVSVCGVAVPEETITESLAIVTQAMATGGAPTASLAGGNSEDSSVRAHAPHHLLTTLPSAHLARFGHGLPSHGILLLAHRYRCRAPLPIPPPPLLDLSWRVYAVRMRTRGRRHVLSSEGSPVS